MKKIVSYILISLILTSCLKDSSYRGIVGTAKTGVERTPVRVSVGTYDAVDLKGNGPINSEEDWMWKDLSIYVYAFRKDAPSFIHTSDDSEDSDDIPPMCLVDAARDVDGAKSGKLAYVNDVDEFVIWDKEDYSLFYPGGDVNGLVGYDFFAYYIDDFIVDETSILRTSEQISFPVEIDGRMDLMSSMAVLRDKQFERKDFSEDEIKNISHNAFSSYTANRNIHPQFCFNHHLSLLDFRIYAGHEEASSVSVQSIEVRTKTQGVFTVAHKDTTKIGVDFSGTEGYMSLMLKETDGQILKTDYYRPVWKEEYSSSGVYKERTVLGGGLMVAPDTSYTCYVKLKQVLPSGWVDEDTKIITLTSTNGYFEQGKKYTVDMEIAGLTVVRVDVTASAWDEGGNIVIDGEDYGQ